MAQTAVGQTNSMAGIAPGKDSMKRILPDIYQLRLPLPDGALNHVNVYVVRVENGCLLVDTGVDSDESFQSLTGQLGEIGFAVRDIRQIIGTHIHSDHYGMAERLREISHAPIALHVREADLVLAYADLPRLIRKQVAWFSYNGMPEEMLKQISRVRMAASDVIVSSSSAKPDILLQDSAVISAGEPSFQVLRTPGHSRGHICLYEPRLKLLIAGDHILADATTFVGFEAVSTANPLYEYITSLNGIRHLDIDTVLPGHGRVFTNFRQRVDETVQSLEQRSAEVLKTMNDEAKTGYQVASEIGWILDGKAVKLENMPLLVGIVSMLKTLAHLEALRFQGKIAKMDCNGLACYRAQAHRF